MYCAEEDLGMIPYNPDPTVAAFNTLRINSAQNESHQHGKFVFANGTMGPIRKAIGFPSGEYFLAYPGVLTSTRVGGGRLIGMGGHRPSYGTGYYRDSHLGGGGLGTRLTRIDGEKGGNVITVRGVNTEISGIEVRGRFWDGDIEGTSGEGPDAKGALPKGTKKTAIGIAIESRSNPPTGWHIIRDCSVSEAECGVCCLRGYYDSNGVLVEDEVHADMGVVDTMGFMGVNNCIRTDNLQSVGWRIRNISTSGRGGAGSIHTTILDLQRAQGISVDGVTIMDFRTTLLNIGKGYFNPFSRELTIKNVKWDRGAHLHAGGTHTLFRYEGVPTFKLAHVKISARIQGEFVYDKSRADGTTPIDVSKILDIPPGLDMSDVLFDITGLKDIPNYSKIFKLVTSGPYVRPIQY